MRKILENLSQETDEQEIALQEPLQETIEEPLQETIEESIQAAVQELTQSTIPEQIQDSVNEDNEDIQFEEVLDLDSIQQKLLDRIYEDDPEIESSQDVNTIINKKAEIVEEKTAKRMVKDDSSAKKYVIYVDQNNIDFMENLSINERKEIINQILKEQNELGIKHKEIEARKKYIKHLLLACITFIIGFPIMFIAVNKSLESIINNYQQAKQNFSKLYKSQGKVKMNEPEAVKHIKY